MSHIRSTDRSAFILLRWLFGLLCWAAIAGATFAAPEAALPEMRIVPGLDEPLVATAVTSGDEDAALSAAIEAFRNPATPPADFAEAAKPLAAFVADYPASGWRMAVLTDLGIGYYRAGYFTKATAAWEQAWSAGRGATEPKAKALADRAFGELARMHARVGHADALEALFADLGDRAVSGPATEMVTGAHEGLWMFRHDWGTAYLCGPMALKTLLVTLKTDPAIVAMMDKERSGPHGYNFAQVSALADRAGLRHSLVHRNAGQPIPVPSVVNWKVNHYAAIVEEKDGRYHVKDPTFASGDLWMSKTAVNAESSGYFLVPKAAAGGGWRSVAADEARQVYGMGFTGDSQHGATTPLDRGLYGAPPSAATLLADAPSPTASGCNGMCIADAKTMVVSLTLNDSPVGYQPPKGPPAFMRLTYNQREASQPAVFTFFNVSPKWTLNVLSWIQDDPANPGQGVLRYVAGGGAIDYAAQSYHYAFDPASGAFTPEMQGQAVLTRIPASGPLVSYELLMNDGSKQVFARSDGAQTSPRRVLLTKIVDKAGNALTLTYDNRLRLTTLTDASGRNTTFAYGAVDPLLVTAITDPFGRTARLAYDSSGRLASITDVLGITSSFTYDAGGLINALTTPYGISRFSYGDGASNSRFLEMTDPLGNTERLEFAHDVFSGNDDTSPRDVDVAFRSYRNTFHWDRHVFPIAHHDYAQAKITHWLHNREVPFVRTSPIVESIKLPLERRIWYRYPDQFQTYFEGSTGTPISSERVLDDNTTQARRYTYNAIGKPLTALDPVGRMTAFTYAANDIDLVSVQQQTNTSGALSTVASFSYNSQHLPLSYTDAAGKVTRYAYNAAGQLLSETNALNQVTSYTYDGLGRLVSVINANGLAQQTLTYDGFDRAATTTDSEGYTVAYRYDVFDRITEVTYPDGTTTQYSYNRLDLAAVKDRLNRVTTYTHDANRRLIAVTDPQGQTTGYGYYENGVLASITDPKGNVTKWDIDIESRPTAKHYANGNVENYAYESSTGRLKSRTDALGQVKSYGYAADDRVAALSYANAKVATAPVKFSYDAFFPRLTTMADGTGTTRFQYQPVGAAGALQLALEDGPYGNDGVGYTYDALGRVATRTVDTAVESFAYDAIGRVITHGSPLGVFARTYLGQTNQMTGQKSASGVGTQWAYEGSAGDRRLRSITNSGQARSFSYTTTPEDLISGITESVGGTVQRSWAYSYDATNRLTKAQPSTGPAFLYGYDKADNLTSMNGVAATVNSANQLVTFGGKPHSYDADGNLIDDGTRTYRWDAENRLVGIGYKAQPGTATAFRYDGLGRRLAIIDTNQFGPNETRYLWCGDSLCQARTAGDQITRRYFPEGFIIPQGNTLLYYGRDQLGSVRDLFTAQNGAKVASFDYEPYGNSLAVSGRVTSDFRYAGMFFHALSGVYLSQTRALDPRTGRWLSRDVIEEVGGLNLYSYVGGSPISLIDPTGLDKQDPVSKVFSSVAKACSALYHAAAETTKRVAESPAVQSTVESGKKVYKDSIAPYTANQDTRTLYDNCAKEDTTKCDPQAYTEIPKAGMQGSKTGTEIEGKVIKKVLGIGAAIVGAIKGILKIQSDDK